MAEGAEGKIPSWVWLLIAVVVLWFLVSKVSTGINKVAADVHRVSGPLSGAATTINTFTNAAASGLGTALGSYLNRPQGSAYAPDYQAGQAEATIDAGIAGGSPYSDELSALQVAGFLP